MAVAANLLHSGKAVKMNGSVFLVATVAVDLAADFATGPPGAVNVDVSGARTDRLEQLVKFSSTDATLIREVCNIHCRDGARDRRWRRGTWLRAGRSIAEVRAKEHADRASYGFLSEVDVSLLNGAFEICVAQLPVNVRIIVTDTRIEGAITGGRNC